MQTKNIGIMAKGSAMGLWKGKKGSSVFYRIWNTNNKEAQGIREYRAEVRNPQSDGQADQRARLLPAQRIKGALRDIVSRSFQGVPYGSKSRLEFLRQAMRLKEGYPFVTKGYQEPVPGRYIISRGSLRQISATFNDDIFVTNLTAGQTPMTADTTIGQLSTWILEDNVDMLEGDQITIVGCLCSMPDAPDVSIYEWYYYSFILDPNNNEEVASLNGYRFIGIGKQNDTGKITLFGPEDNLCAAAIIISRLGEDGAYLRSTAQLAVADFMSVFFSPSQAAVTRASYQTQTSQNSTDWPVEEDTRGGGSSVTDGEFTIAGATGTKAGFNGMKCKVRINTLTGSPAAVYVANTSDNTLVDVNGNELTIIPQGGELTYLFKADVPALASLPSVLYS